MVVLDDAADSADLSGLWPPASASGRVVVTTRRRDAALASRGRLIPVGLFTPGEAHTYLREKFADRPDRLVQPDQLAEDLGFLPLMLGQAAAFIADQDITSAQYRSRFANAKQLLDVVPEPGGMPDDYRLPVAAALLLSVGAADQLRPAGLARQLLTLLNLLDPNGIPEQAIIAPAALDYLHQHRPTLTTADQVDAATDGLASLARLQPDRPSRRPRQ